VDVRFGEATSEPAVVALGESERSSGHAIVVGDDRVALAICKRLAEFEGDGCVLLGAFNDEARAEVERLGTRYLASDPARAATLEEAGIATARCLLLLGDNDRLNLDVALTARDLSPDIRIVMRQFNRALGRKLEAKMSNTTVVSLASQSGAIFAAATVDPANYYGVQFPDIDGRLFGFADRLASDLGIEDERVGAIERRLGCRVLTASDLFVTPDRTIGADERVVTFSRVDPRAPHAKRFRPRRPPSLLRAVGNLLATWRRADPLARRLTISGLAFFFFATIFFVGILHIDPITSAYFVLTTMTTTGYGDIVPHATDHVEQLAAMVTMLAGVVLTALFVALVTANFTQARYRALQGLRRIDASEHIVVCGAGRVGSRVINFLTRLGCEVVVIERNPSAEIIERAREREFALLTADATADATLAFCNLNDATAIVALTESDTMNLEVVLGAQAINPNLPAVVRVLEGDFARKIATHFHIDRAFGAADIVSPVLAGLSFRPGIRGFLHIAGREYAVSQEEATPEFLARLAITEGAIALAAVSVGEVRTIASIAEIEPDDDAVLFLYPAYRFRKDAPIA
jgi:Trk K+ transport system NAD-binding subunit